MSKIEGGCLCGQVRYTSTEEPVMTAVCHCKSCQRETGSSYSVLVAVSEASLSVTGDSLSKFQTTGDSGKPTHRHFCNQCGSPLFSTSEVVPDMAFVKAGTLDDTSWFEPQMHIWCSEKQSWIEIDPKLAQAEKNPQLGI
jgi:hypothetical protein